MIKENTVEVKDLETHYVEAGEGKQTIVFLHGWGGSAESWRDNISELGKYYHCIALDIPLQRNESKSQNPSIAWGIEEYHSYFLEFLQKIGLGEQFILIGKSFGGRMAIRYASENPDRLKAMILVSAAGIERRDPKAALIQSIAHIGKMILGNALTEKLRGTMNEVLGIEQSEPPLRRRTREIVTSQDLSSRLSHIQTPTLIIWGDNDQILPLWHAQEMRASIPNSDLVVIQGADHFLHERSPEQFNGLVRQFVDNA